MSKLSLYLLLQVLPSVSNFGMYLIVAGLLTVAGSITLLFIWIDDSIGDIDYKNKRIIKRITFIGLSMMITGTLINVLIPNTKKITAIYGINYVSELNGADRLPSNTIKLLNKYIDDNLASK